MGKVESLWTGVVKELDSNVAALGITGAERAELGKVTNVKSPGCTVWLEFAPATYGLQQGAVSMGVEVHIFCIGPPQAKRAQAIDAAFGIAEAVIGLLAGSTVGGCFLRLPQDSAFLALVDSSSNAAVVGVVFETEVIL